MNGTIAERNLRMIIRTGLLGRRLTVARKKASLMPTFDKDDLASDKEVVAALQTAYPDEKWSVAGIRRQSEKALEVLRFAYSLPRSERGKIFAHF